MKVAVRFFTILRELVGKSEETFNFDNTRGLTVEDLLKFLANKYGRDFVDYIFDVNGEVRGYLQFLVNGRSVTTLDGFATKLGDGDKVAIIPPVGGG